MCTHFVKQISLYFVGYVKVFHVWSLSRKSARMTMGTMGNRQIVCEEADFGTCDANYP